MGGRARIGLCIILLLSIHMLLLSVQGAVEDCGDVGLREKCLSLNHCRWCRSETLNDGCFQTLESRRLPVQVFDCVKV